MILLWSAGFSVESRHLHWAVLIRICVSKLWCTTSIAQSFCICTARSITINSAEKGSWRGYHCLFLFCTLLKIKRLCTQCMLQCWVETVQSHFESHRYTVASILYSVFKNFCRLELLDVISYDNNASLGTLDLLAADSFFFSLKQLILRCPSYILDIGESQLVLHHCGPLAPVRLQLNNPWSWHSAKTAVFAE